MTLKEHLKTARALVKIRQRLMELYCLGPRRIKIINKKEQVRMIKIVDLVDSVKCTMDDVYFRSVDRETFDKLGYIYYKVD